MKLRMSITCIMMTLSEIGNSRIVGSLKLGCYEGILWSPGQDFMGQLGVNGSAG